MTAKYDVIECDVMLLGWSETHNGGEKVTFQLQPGQIEFFKNKTLKKGKTAGQLFKMVLVEVDGNGEPLPQESGGVMADAKGKALLDEARRRSQFPGGLCGLAVRWCEDRDFREWLGCTFPGAVQDSPSSGWDAKSTAAWVVKHICKIDSRKELDTNADAAETFKTKILHPYAASRKERGLDE